MPSPNREETYRILASSRLLDVLPGQEIVDLLPHVKHQDHPAGAPVFLVGTPDTDFCWLASGRVRLTTKNRNGDELLHGMVEVGDHFGEVTPIDGGLRGVNAIADRYSSVLSLDRDILLPVILRHPDAGLRLAQLLCQQIRIAGETLHNLALNNAESRIWTRLMQMANTYGSTNEANGSIHIAHGLSQQDLAATVGLTRVKVNRQLTMWRQAGLVEYGRGYVVIADPEAFESYVWEKVDPASVAAGD